MDKLVNFLVDNYIIFLVIALILVFALIGYLVDSKKKSGKQDVTVPDEADEMSGALKQKNDNQNEEMLKETIKPMANVSLAEAVKTETPSEKSVANSSKLEELDSDIASVSTNPNNDGLGSPLTMSAKKEEDYDVPLVVEEDNAKEEFVIDDK